MNDLELKIAKFLRVGVIFSGLVMLTGWVLKFRWDYNVFTNFEHYDRLPLLTLLEHHYKLKDWGILISYAGLFVLISLPLIRVLLTAFLFVKQKEKLLAVIAMVVFFSLCLSMFLGIEL